MFNVILDNEIDNDSEIKVVKRPSIPCPKRKYREIEIEGRDGKLYEDLETYEDIEISVEYNFLSNDYNNIMRKVKKWILNKTKLKFSDDLEYFYKIQKISIEGNERVWKRLGRFSTKFTCKPFSYLEDGLNSITLTGNSLYNDYYISEPIYNITGNGMCTLTVNGKTMVANVGGNLTIDTELMLAYRQDGIMQNTSVTGKYEDLKLAEGDNSISITNGFILSVVPNWRVV